MENMSEISMPHTPLDKLGIGIKLWQGCNSRTRRRKRSVLQRVEYYGKRFGRHVFTTGYLLSFIRRPGIEAEKCTYQLSRRNHHQDGFPLDSQVSG